MGQNFSSEPVVEKETERAENDTFKAAVSSCQGWRMSQEDNHSLMLELPQSEHKASFFAVYDGHGSARVSKHASEGLWRHLTSNPHYKKGEFKEALEQAFLSFDNEVNESYTAQLAGTTAVCVLIVDNVIYCANIGDSRAVASVNCVCEPLSYDHKPDNPGEYKRIMAAGGYVLGNRVNGNLALSRAFGDFHYKSNQELSPEQQIVSPHPDVKRIELNDDVEFIVLACDGIWDVLTSEEVVNFVISRLEHNIEPGLICEQLTTRCLATDYELVIGCDNMTVLLVCHVKGRSWTDYCSHVFAKNTTRLGVPRERSFNMADLEDDTDVHRRRQKQMQHLQQQTQAQEDQEYVDVVGGSAFLRNPMGNWTNRDEGASEPGTANNDGLQSSDDFGSHIPGDIQMLLNAIQNLHSDDESNANVESSDDSSNRITELPNEDSSDSKNEPIDSTAQSTSDQDVSSNKDSKAVADDDNDINDQVASKITEIILNPPDDDDDDAKDNSAEIEESNKDETITEPTPIIEEVTNTLELGDPEDESQLPDIADAEPIVELNDTSEDIPEDSGGGGEDASGDD